MYKKVAAALYEKSNFWNLTLGILLVVIQLGVTGVKNTKVVYLLDLFGGRGEKGQCDLVCLECL